MNRTIKSLLLSVGLTVIAFVVMSYLSEPIINERYIEAHRINNSSFGFVPGKTVQELTYRELPSMGLVLVSTFIASMAIGLSIFKDSKES